MKHSSYTSMMTLVQYTTSYTTSYMTSYTIYDIRHRIRHRMRYRILTYDAVYDVVFTSNVIRRRTVLASRTYDIVGHIVYDIVGQTYDVVYDIAFTYDVIRWRTVLANGILRRRIRHCRFFYDVVYDIVRVCQRYTMSIYDVVGNITIIRYRVVRTI